VGSGTPSSLYVKFTTYTLISRGALYNNHLPHVENSAAHRSLSPSKLCPLTALTSSTRTLVSLWSLLTFLAEEERSTARIAEAAS